jgi:hypothetical protein
MHLGWLFGLARYSARIYFACCVEFLLAIRAPPTNWKTEWIWLGLLTVRACNQSATRMDLGWPFGRFGLIVIQQAFLPK